MYFEGRHFSEVELVSAWQWLKQSLIDARLSVLCRRTMLALAKLYQPYQPQRPTWISTKTVYRAPSPHTSNLLSPKLEHNHHIWATVIHKIKILYIHLRHFYPRRLFLFLRLVGNVSNTVYCFVQLRTLVPMLQSWTQRFQIQWIGDRRQRGRSVNSTGATQHARVQLSKTRWIIKSTNIKQSFSARIASQYLVRTGGAIQGGGALNSKPLQVRTSTRCLDDVSLKRSNSFTKRTCK